MKKTEYAVKEDSKINEIASLLSKCNYDEMNNLVDALTDKVGFQDAFNLIHVLHTYMNHEMFGIPRRGKESPVVGPIYNENSENRWNPFLS